MTNAEAQLAKKAVLNLAKIEIPYVLSVQLLGQWFKERGIPITTENLDRAYNLAFPEAR